MNDKVYSVQRRIDSLESKARLPSINSDLELQAQLASFLCVLSSGLIEQAVVSSLDDYTRARSSPGVARYASYHLGRIQNAKFEDILVLLGRFDFAWRVHFERTTPAEIKDAINSIVNNRNQIAHGVQVNVSLGAFAEYYKGVKTFVATLQSYVNSQP